MKSMALIGSVVAAWCAAMVLAFASMGTAQEVLPEANPLTVGCAAAANLAAVGHLSLTRCRQVAVVIDGNTALVTVKVWIAGQGQYIVRLVLYRTQWSQQFIEVTPA